MKEIETEASGRSASCELQWEAAVFDSFSTEQLLSRKIISFTTTFLLGAELRPTNSLAL